MSAQPQARPSELQAWILAARPKTLPAVTAAVVAGCGAALAEGVFRPLLALAALGIGLLLQIGANLANDYFDYFKGADTPERLGPLRVTASGLLTPAQVRQGMIVVFGTAGLLGAGLALSAGWPALLAGVAAILAAIVYSGGPRPYGYHGLGDLAVFIFFGPVAVCGTHFVQAGRLSWLALAASLPMGFLITALLVVNNLRDIPTDRAAGKRTLAVLLGRRGAIAEYLALLAGAYLVPSAMIALGLASGRVLYAWLTLPYAYRQVRIVLAEEGRSLNQALAGTSQLALYYAVLFSVGIIF